MKIMNSRSMVAGAAIMITLCYGTPSYGQQDRAISVWQFRQVKPENVDEFIKRETTYWAEVAKRALDKGNLTFWALLERVGGYDIPNSSNYLFVNTLNNIDGVGAVWSADAMKAAFPNVPMNKIETGSLSTTTSMFFMHAEGWQQAANANPDNDFKYIKMNFITSSNPGQLVELEKQHWAPFIKKAMDAGQTSQKGWGNAIVLSPLSENIHANSVSYDLYPNLQEALYPKWADGLVVPDGLSEITKLETVRRGEYVYRIVKVVSK